MDLEDVNHTLSLTISSLSLNITDHNLQCSETGSTFHTFAYTTLATPTIQSVSHQNVIIGDRIVLELTGISETQDDNILVFGGTSITCTSSNPPILSTTTIHPTRDPSPTGRTHSNYMVECVVPELPAGRYRPVLYVAGRGWGHSSLEDTVLTVHPKITSSLSVAAGSLRGGTSITFSTQGLSRDDALRTRVEIGNTACEVQDIDDRGSLTCSTQAAVDDGYSSLVEASSPLAYWSLQTEYHRSNGSYLSSDGLMYFRSSGVLGAQANASIHGTVLLQQAGISGNNLTNQAILFSSAAYLLVPALQELLDPAGFAMEFWVKAPQSSQHYQFLVDAASTCGTSACGFVVLVNPCHQIEFWLASGESVVESERGGSGDGAEGRSGSGDGAEGRSSSGIGGLGPDSSGSGMGTVSEEGTAVECTLIEEESGHCSQPCIGSIRTLEQELQLPSGTWHIIRSSQLNLSDWNHVYFSWHSKDCVTSDLCNGTQELAVNADYQATHSVPLRANTSIKLGGSSSIPLGATATRNGLAPFIGFLDEVAYYSHPLQQQEVRTRVTHGVPETQPLWLTVEAFDGVGTGSIPDLAFPPADTPLTHEHINWEMARSLDLTRESGVLLHFQWTG